MMFNNMMVCCLKANGKVLREFKDTIYIPFGSEYSITLKNLNSVRAIVNVFIDGDNIVEGGLVINAGQEIDLQRSIRNNNLNEGNSLKFIERTGSIEEHRGIKLEDGLIRIEFQFEKVHQRQDGIQWNNDWNNARFFRGLTGNIGNIGLTGATLHDTSGNIGQLATMALTTNVAAATAQAQSLNNVGITVPGSKSDQKFSTASWFPTESEKHVMIFKLLGETADNKPVVAPVTVKAKPKCVPCGKVNKATASYCDHCGTALTLF